VVVSYAGAVARYAGVVSYVGVASGGELRGSSEWW
jgi:hypothetical protein